MSYLHILNILRETAVDGPHLALGLRKPGEENGIWLFGESHEQLKEYGAKRAGFQNFVHVADLLQKEHAADTVLMCENPAFTPGKKIFGDAPPAVKDAVSSLSTSASDYGDFMIRVGVHDEPEKDDDDDDDLPPIAEGGEQETDSDEQITNGRMVTDERNEEGYAVTKADPLTRLAWKDPPYWDWIAEEIGFVALTSEKFRSRGGVSINIENKIRRYFLAVIMQHEENATHVDVDVFFLVLTWALRENVIPSTEPVGGRFVGITGLSRESSRDFFDGLLSNIRHRWDVFSAKLMGDVVGGMLVLLSEDKETGKPLMFTNDNTIHDFVGLLMMVLMDMNIVPRMSENIGKSFVSYCGAQHTINQYLILHHQGYKLEHTYFNRGFDYISPSSKTWNPTVCDNAPLEASLSFLKSLLT
ncbi:unnamed protein product [Ectocarpus sp. 6 AP-2014]